MTPRIAALLKAIEELEETLEEELAERREEFRVGLERGRVVFEEEIRRRHREFRTGLWAYLKSARLAVVLTAPLIYGMIVPLALLDLAVTVYQAICFPVYGIARVRRSDHLVIDRHHLAYLNVLERLNCLYCGYANGLISYVREIAGRTEQYWCPIKHARRTAGPHPHYFGFSDFGDAEAYKAQLDALRAELAKELNRPPAS